ncbi:MAG: tRNA preQ1(34) S-adenosylmethionine ribosyltransferase-isomerase QueA [Acidimicrobiaceae bacterium]|jgi:S-adenosylmethionine:tRNA ribosyltransferase-isomerase|nr:tRNA preQ1(34) S-adenosylmethionine ribosyltransferase-isomerase QueA [Acidimicrobiaceae bacterium]|tara:strand:- start:5922 stop:6923 length:1002 start_codon:yes stop_codon:yes gene_type:complete
MGPDDFFYELQESSIAQDPLVERSSAKMLVDLGQGPEHLHIREFPKLLRPNDVVVVNNTRVLPGRLFLKKKTGGTVEILLLKPRSENIWEALVRPSRKVRPGTELKVSSELTICVGEDLGEGRRLVEVSAQSNFLSLLERYGQVPLPPYIKKELKDSERYQTVFSDKPSSSAAPTAGLHFTQELLDECRSMGARIEEIELAIGLDTFRPITATDLDDHNMHSEFYNVSETVMESCREAERVIAIGTTTVRALESAHLFGLSGQTKLFIRDPFEFQVVDVLLTNFHLPRSTLLVMIEAFIGSYWRNLYEVAQEAGYRFLSFGDAMLISKRETRK